ERLTETLLLKINLLAQAVGQVESQTRIRRRPFLRLDQDSFRVHLAAPGPGLPAFWNARVELVADSAAEPVSLGQTDLPYFLPPDALSPSVYQPKSTPVYRRSAATIRIREVFPSSDGRTALDLTFATDDELPAAASDLVHLTLPAGGGTLDVYGHPDKPRGLAEHEVRIRTLPQAISPAVCKDLERMAGLPLTKVPFELLPRLTSPYDLYALAVTGARVLLSAEENPLPIVIDELLSFAVQLASEPHRQKPLGQRIIRLFEQEARWSRTLGPQNVRRQPSRDGQPEAKIPLELWAEVLAILVKSLPGGPDSYCRDFGDAPPLALETAFHGPLTDLRRLEVILRGTVTNESEPNAEVQSAIDEVRQGLIRAKR
ncbi:MAG: hypothetical protein JOY92_17005, partial [Verrucomicrobia bacterium]|nr:hypothetical protein [Verrucomicrobiota bacterium]